VDVRTLGRNGEGAFDIRLTLGWGHALKQAARTAEQVAVEVVRAEGEQLV
jgi:hypothetical protein